MARLYGIGSVWLPTQIGLGYVQHFQNFLRCRGCADILTRTGISRMSVAGFCAQFRAYRQILAVTSRCYEILFNL
jgi:hypothetical protein